jgi:serine O-acetyltransferase
MTWLSDLREDLRRDGSTLITVIPRLLLAPRTQAVALVRLGQASPGLVGPLARRLNLTLNGCDISPHAKIGPGLHLPHPVGVVIGPEVVIGARCTLYHNTTLGMGGSGSPVLQDDIHIGIGVVAFGGITIGSGARIAPNSVLRIDVPPGSLAAGAPATLKTR